MISSKSLLQSIASHDYLRHSWEKLNKSNKESYGISNETIAEFNDTLEIQIKEISKQLLYNKYKFNGVRAVLIPKKIKGEFRPLRIADIRDRLVQKALSNKLEELLASKYNLDNDCSFAYRKDIGINDAISKMVEHFNNGNRIILEADIRKFFDTVNKKCLLDKVFKDLPDDSVNHLIEESLAQSVGNLENIAHEHHHYFLDSIEGIPQGNSLSPLLANIYLSDFDRRMSAESFCLVRYADDFIVLCKTVNDAKHALAIAKEELEDKLGLELHALPSPTYKLDSKTRIVDPYHHKFSFLSIRFDGKNVWVSENKIKDLLERITIVTDIDRYQKDRSFQGLFTVIKRLKNLLEGWLASYKFVDVDRDFLEIDNYVNHKLLQVFVKLGYKIKTSATEDVKLKNSKKIVQTFSQLQRQNSGIPTCENFVNSLNRNKIQV